MRRSLAIVKFSARSIDAINGVFPLKPRMFASAPFSTRSFTISRPSLLEAAALCQAAVGFVGDGEFDNAVIKKLRNVMF